MDDQHFDQIVADFYQSAAGEQPWGVGMERLRVAMGARVVTLHGLIKSGPSVAFSFEVGDVPPQAALDFIRHYQKIEPRTQLLVSAPVGHVMSCHRHFDDAFVATDPYHQEFLIPYGLRYCTVIKAYEDERQFVLCGVHRGVGSPPLNDSEEAVMRRLGMHLQQALAMHLGQSPQPQHIGIDILNRLTHPILLVDDTRRLIFHNDSAARFIQTHPALQLDHGLMCGPTPEDDARILIALRSLALSSHSHLGAMQLALDKSHCLLKTPQGRRIGLSMHALRPEGTMHAFGAQPLALVFLHDPDMRARLDDVVVAAMWGLTPAEAQAVAALGQGLSVQEIALQRRVSQNTVRSQIQMAMGKMGATRQAELVSMACTIPMTLGQL